MMKCVIVQDGRPVLATRPRPAPGPGEVLIRVRAAGVNRPDLLQVAGRYPPPPGASDILGLECAGEVAAHGLGVGAWAMGGKVCALLTGGGYAEYATAPAGQCLPMPNGLTFAEAASLPETYFTVWSNVVDRARLAPGESLLVHGGASGIGVAAIQIAKALGARVMVTAGGAAKCQACLALGADLAVDHTAEDFVPAAKVFGHGRGVDVILDMVGGDYVARNLDALAPGGRLVNIAFLEGSRVEVDLLPVMLKRLTLTGSTLRARDPDFKAAIARALEARVWPWLESGAVRPVVHGIFPLERVQDAHETMRGRGNIGKIVLQIA